MKRMKMPDGRNEEKNKKSGRKNLVLGSKLRSLIKKNKPPKESICIPLDSDVLFCSSSFKDINELVPFVQIGEYWYQFETAINLMIEEEYSLKYNGDEIIFNGANVDILKLSCII